MSGAMLISGNSLSVGELMPELMKIRSLTGAQQPRLLYIPAASYDMPLELDDFSGVMAASDVSVQTLCLTSPNATAGALSARLSAADIIYIEKGDCAFLFNTANRLCFGEALRNAFKSGRAVVGTGSGAAYLCAGAVCPRTGETLKGAGIFDFAYSETLNPVPGFEKTLVPSKGASIIKSGGESVVCGSAVIISSAGETLERLEGA